MFGFGPVTKHIGVETATSLLFQYVAVVSFDGSTCRTRSTNAPQNRYGRGWNWDACAPSGGLFGKNRNDGAIFRRTTIDDAVLDVGGECASFWKRLQEE